MKLRKTLTISGKQCPLVEDDVRLDMSMAGRAQFRIQADGPVSGLVTFSLGYSSETADQLYFTGYVERSVTVDASTQRIFCRELVAVMNYHHPVSLRHPTLQDVIAALANRTGLSFVVPEERYASKPVAHFQTLGNGFHALDMIGAVFGIEDYVWQQQADGKVFVGSWQHSRWATRPITLEETVFTKVLANGSKQLGAIPALRPGIRLNGEYISSIQLTGHKMVLQCEKVLNA